VQNEFASLAEDAGIYRLVGPVLLKQEKTEAVSTVDGRLDFIGKEIIRTETRIRELQAGSEKKRVELMQLQQRLQMAAQEQGAG
jgi:prefoldin beta subunit